VEQQRSGRRYRLYAHASIESAQPECALTDPVVREKAIGGLGVGPVLAR
jgi:hypothetical protein